MWKEGGGGGGRRREEFLVSDGRFFLPNVRLMDFQIDVRPQLGLRKIVIKIACTIA